VIVNEFVFKAAKEKIIIYRGGAEARRNA